MKTVLTIAGSDPFGGAGMQADIKTITAHGLYAMSAVTLLSVQSSLGFYEVDLVSPDFLVKQVVKLFEDLRPNAVKTGMLLDPKQIKRLGETLKKLKPEFLIVDPVMVSNRTNKMVSDETFEALTKDLIPLAYLITPNRAETEMLAGIEISTKEDMQTAAKLIFDKYGVNVLTKSDAQGADSDDLLYTEEGPYWIAGEKIETTNVRGTGDALSAAIACNLSKGYDLQMSCVKAKAYVTRAIRDEIKIGQGPKGPINNMVGIEGEF